MRTKLAWMTALVLALAGAGIASAVPNTQTIEGAFLPKKLPKKERAPVSLFTDVAATNSGNPDNLPNPTVLAKVDYDKDGKFQQKGYPTCPEDGSDPRQTFGAAATTQEVRQECPDAIIGDGSATVAVPNAPGTPPTLIQADVIAANVSQNRVLLHSYNTTTGATPLVGTISRADAAAGSKYGLTLTVPVPPLAGGIAVITQFAAKIDKISYRFGGKKRALLSARCGPGKRLWAQARFTDDEGQLATGTFSQPCKQKKTKKKKG